MIEVGCRHPQDEAATEQLSHLAHGEKGPHGGRSLLSSLTYTVRG